MDTADGLPLSVFLRAIDENDLQFVQKLHEHIDIAQMEVKVQDTLCAFATLNARRKILRWLCKRYSRIPKEICDIAAQKCDIVTLDWALREGCSKDVSMCRAAAANGHLKVLEWAHSHSGPSQPSWLVVSWLVGAVDRAGNSNMVRTSHSDESQAALLQLDSFENDI